jgi:hypothetical protein
MKDSEHEPDILPGWFHTRRRTALAGWTLVALLNLTAGVVIASWPERQSDFDTIQRWGRDWLVRGIDIYASDWDYPDYPPHAIVVLSPLGVLEKGPAIVVWAALNLALLALIPFLAIRHVRPQVTLAAAAIPILMFLTWSGCRALLQYTLIALTCGLLACLTSARRPVFAGLCLGLALMKPQIAAPFFVWALLAKRWATIVASFATILAGFAIYCLRVGADPVEVIEHYVAILRHLYAGDAIMIGLAQLRPLFALMTDETSAVDALVLASSVSLLAVAARVAFLERGIEPRLWVAAPPLIALWSLLTFYHLTYGFVILAPLFAVLLFGGQSENPSLRRRIFWVLQLGLMFDVPGLVRRFGQGILLDDSIFAPLMHVDRAMMLALFAATVFLAVRTLHVSYGQAEARQRL